MKTIIWIVMAVFMGVGTIQAGTPKAYFSPKGGCQATICHEVSLAKSNIVIAAYQYSNIAIIGEIYKAQKRGVAISIIVDPGILLVTNSPIIYACTNGISAWVDSKHAIFHDKYMVVDHKKVITGSFNYSQSAENRNAENVIVLQDVTLAKQYEADWAVHQAHSVKLPAVIVVPTNIVENVVHTNVVPKYNGQ